jgi:hypothetical protein
MESRMRGDTHVRFGSCRRLGETERRQRRHRAPSRPRKFTLPAASLAGVRDREDNMICIVCADLACPVRGKLRFARYEEYLTLDGRLARMAGNLMPLRPRSP